MGHFSHSILVTEPNSVIRIKKFQQFWNFLESVESLDKYHKFVCFGQMGQFFHSKLSPGFDSSIKIEKFKKMWYFQKIPKEFHWNSENSTIFGIFRFLLQNHIQGLILSGKTIPFGQNRQTCDIYREIPQIPKNSRIVGISRF